MSVQNAGTLAKRNGGGKMTFSAYITSDAIKNKINAMVGGKDGQRFITSILSAVSINPSLAECDHGTIVSAALLGESLKLSPSPQLGQYYMVPYNDKRKGKVAQFQLGYKGYMQLAIRSGYYKKINAMPIKEGELVRFNPLEEEIEVNLIDDDIVREETPTTGYYAMFEYKNGFRKAMYWSKKKMLSHADKYSKAFSAIDYQKLQEGKIPKTDEWKYSSFWYKDFDTMALKTMLRQLISKWGIMSIDMQKAYSTDTATLNEDGEVMYVDNQSDANEASPTTASETVESEYKEVSDSHDNQQSNPVQDDLEADFFNGEEA